MNPQFRAITGSIKILESAIKVLKNSFHDNFKCLILYGSWAKGTAREDSDIDLLALFEKVDEKTRRVLHQKERDIDAEISVTIVPASVDDFQKEKIPLYTAAKKEGRIIYGETDLTINPEEPHIKYAEAFEKSKEFEMKKVKMAEEILKEYPSYGAVDLCFVASKHAIQMVLAMKGVGYSSKVATLLLLTQQYLGREVAETFRKLFKIYVKAEYELESVTEQESKLALEYAKEIMEIYDER